MTKFNHSRSFEISLSGETRGSLPVEWVSDFKADGTMTSPTIIIIHSPFSWMPIRGVIKARGVATFGALRTSPADGSKC